MAQMMAGNNHLTSNLSPLADSFASVSLLPTPNVLSPAFSHDSNNGALRHSPQLYSHSLERFPSPPITPVGFIDDSMHLSHFHHHNGFNTPNEHPLHGYHTTSPSNGFDPLNLPFHSSPEDPKDKLDGSFQFQWISAPHGADMNETPLNFVSPGHPNPTVLANFNQLLGHAGAALHVSPSQFASPVIPSQISEESEKRMKDMHKSKGIHGTRKTSLSMTKGKLVKNGSRTSQSKDGRTNSYSNSHDRPTILECNVCGKQFTRTFNLKSHQKTHTHERPFICRWKGCAKSFARKHDCLRHERIHAAPVSTRRPFLCPAPACTRRFAHARGVEKHLRGHRSCAAAALSAGKKVPPTVSSRDRSYRAPSSDHDDDEDDDNEVDEDQLDMTSAALAAAAAAAGITPVANKSRNHVSFSNEGTK
jgi:hypothetical protein